jgi:hypothetical protein
LKRQTNAWRSMRQTILQQDAGRSEENEGAQSQVLGGYPKGVVGFDREMIEGGVSYGSGGASGGMSSGGVGGGVSSSGYGIDVNRYYSTTSSPSKNTLFRRIHADSKAGPYANEFEETPLNALDPIGGTIKRIDPVRGDNFPHSFREGGGVRTWNPPILQIVPIPDKRITL